LPSEKPRPGREFNLDKGFTNLSKSRRNFNIFFCARMFFHFFSKLAEKPAPAAVFRVKAKLKCDDGDDDSRLSEEKIKQKRRDYEKKFD
jgi:hypothetical protein